MRGVITKLQRPFGRGQGQAAQRRKSNPDKSARFQFGTDGCKDGSRLWHMLHNMVENNEIVTALRNCRVARTVNTERVESVYRCKVVAINVVFLDISAGVMATRKPAFGGAWRIVPTANIQNSRRWQGKFAPRIQELCGADMHRNPHRLSVSFSLRILLSYLRTTTQIWPSAFKPINSAFIWKS